MSPILYIFLSFFPSRGPDMTNKIFTVLLCLMAATASGADKMVVGYYPSWMSGTFPHTAIPWQYLTHINHAFIGPQADGQLDVPSDFLYPELISAAHTNGVKVVVSLGGWNETYSAAFSALAADSTARRTFADTLKQFCITNGYDGADIDWEYPATTADRTNHVLMIHAIRQAFDSAQPKLTLSMVGPATDWNGKWFDLASTKNDFDWFGTMTYDFYGDWMTVAGPHSALYGSTPPNDQGWVDMSVGYYTSTRGIPKEKLLIGVPFYGWTFNAASLYGAATGSPRAIQETYDVIAPRLNQGWTRFWDATGQVPYMQDAGHTKLTTYDDSTSVAAKAAYVVSKGVAGAVIWALGQDLVGGHPVLLEALGKGLRPVTSVAEEQAVPQEFALEQNYPNPFNPKTVVSSQLSVVSNVRIVIYDVLGREVATLVNERRSPGIYHDTFDASSLASGVYVYRLTAGLPAGQAGSFVQAKTMVLVK
jgi:chitinase